ncbi:unnamed protein product [Lathyrus oleraceus]
MFKFPTSQHPLPSSILSPKNLTASLTLLSSSAMHITTMSIESNKENIPPVYTKGVNKKISISIMASSCKRIGKRKIKKRTPLADITHLFHNSMTRQENGVSSASIQLHLDSRRRALAVVSGSKKLRIGFR